MNRYDRSDCPDRQERETNLCDKRKLRSLKAQKHFEILMTQLLPHDYMNLLDETEKRKQRLQALRQAKATADVAQGETKCVLNVPMGPF